VKAICAFREALQIASLIQLDLRQIVCSLDFLVLLGQAKSTVEFMRRELKKLLLKFICLFSPLH
jgi:hypothetical protein